MLSAKAIVKKYGTVKVLNGVDIDIRKGEIVSITGASGAGKSTLLHILGTLDQPDQGSININGVETNKLSSRELSNFRNRNIGFIFQFHHLLPEFSALENVCIPSWIGKIDRKNTTLKAKKILTELGLEDRMEHKPSALSGGEQQRVAVARALINDPFIILADEPTGNLDSTNANEMHQLFLRLREQYQQTFLIVTHNEELAKMSDRILHMRDGKISDIF